MSYPEGCAPTERKWVLWVDWWTIEWVIGQLGGWVGRMVRCDVSSIVILAGPSDQPISVDQKELTGRLGTKNHYSRTSFVSPPKFIEIWLQKGSGQEPKSLVTKGRWPLKEDGPENNANLLRHIFCRKHNKRIMDTAKYIKRHANRKASGSMLSIPGSRDLSTSGNESCESIYGSSNRSSLYISDSDGTSDNFDSLYGWVMTLVHSVHRCPFWRTTFQFLLWF